MGIITVTNLGKAYRQYPNRWSRLAEWLTPGNKPRHNLKWVLQDISFTVQPGEAVGIIGINGAGKSTLLKMITGTTQPTTGSVHITGRVAALLELGMGFHPDFTGRQNAFMAGQLLGYSVEEIARLMPEIEAFAEIGDYIDQPVRTYSSGMQMRLAFSVATANRPDVLIVDEALSVGDAYFQHKSFQRIRTYKEQGTTLLIVSHDKQAILSICDKAILLNSANLIMQGSPEAVLDYYSALIPALNNQSIKQTVVDEFKIATVSGTGEASLTNVTLMDESDFILDSLDVGQSVCLQFTVKCHSDIENLVFGYGIKDKYGQVMYGTNTHLKNQSLKNVKKDSLLVFDVYFNANLGPGSYSVQTSLTSSEDFFTNNYEWRDLAYIFTVVNSKRPYFAGCLWIDPIIKIKSIPIFFN